jgi:aryl-alcohol dehydrogenase-like predicted oxidoreductase
MQFGGRADEAASRAMYDAARAAGVTEFDTAHGYTEGNSERLLGRFAKGDDAVRIATKVGYEGGSGRANLSAQFSQSLQRLGVDKVDLLYLHRFDPATSLEETIGLLVEWQLAGRIDRIGVSNFAAWQVMKAQAVAARQTQPTQLSLPAAQPGRAGPASLAVTVL